MLGIETGSTLSPFLDNMLLKTLGLVVRTDCVVTTTKNPEVSVLQTLNRQEPGRS